MVIRACTPVAETSDHFSPLFQAPSKVVPEQPPQQLAEMHGSHR